MSPNQPHAKFRPDLTQTYIGNYRLQVDPGMVHSPVLASVLGNWSMYTDFDGNVNRQAKH